MHNLAPHRHSEEGAAIYEAWGAAADVVIHHSEYGRKIAVERYDFDGRTTHVVISHGHWAHLMNKYAIFDRDEVESDEGWPKASLRLAVVGQPRTEKHLADVIEAARSCGRDDIQFVIRCDPQHHHLSTQKVRLEHGHLSPERYYRRFAAYDGLILPFEEGQMLGSGTVFDSIGAGIAAIGTDWGFQTEMLGEALITYKTDTLRDTLHRMTPDDVARSATAVRALQPRFDWAVAGRHTAATLLERDGIDPVDGHDGQLAFRHVESR
jgi:glycosyltransferase involved in cell wall biosynthesis